MNIASRRVAGLSACALLAAAHPVAAQSFSPNDGVPFDLGDKLSAAVTLGDIDGDGDVDVLVANGRHWAEADFAFLNVGNGRPLWAHPVGDGMASSYTIQLGDLDRDGDLDAMTVHDSLPVMVFHNDGTGRFAFHSVAESDGEYARGGVSLDANGDGVADLVVFRRLGANLLLLGDGEGGLEPATDIVADGSGATGGQAADLDGDGDIDVLVARRDDNTSLVLENDGTGQFTVHELAGTKGDHRAGVVGDFNGDGIPDIMLAGKSGIEWLAGKGDLQYGLPREAAEDLGVLQALAAGDLDGDGDIDAVAGANGVNTLLLNDGSGTFRTKAMKGDPADTYGLALGDMDGNGKLDMVVANSGSDNWVMRQGPIKRH